MNESEEGSQHELLDHFLVPVANEEDALKTAKLVTQADRPVIAL